MHGDRYLFDLFTSSQPHDDAQHFLSVDALIIYIFFPSLFHDRARHHEIALVGYDLSVIELN